jgi:hypothetical protein
VACLSWAIGSLYSRRAPLPKSVLQATGMEMIGGGILLTLVGSVRGEWAAVDLSAVSFESSVAFVYLIIFGSLIGFTAYIWLLQHTSAAAVSTYAYVNPVVAVLLGCTIGHEPFTTGTLIASILIIAAVMMITIARSKSTPALATHEPSSAISATQARDTGDTPTRATPASIERIPIGAGSETAPALHPSAVASHPTHTPESDLCCANDRTT